MQKTLISFLALSLLLSVSANLSRLHIKRSLDSSDSEDSDSDNGIVPLTGPGTFVVAAGLGYNSTSNTSVSSVNMMLSLYTSQSLLASSCMGFTSYSSSQNLVQATNVPSNVTFVNFDAQGKYLNTKLVLDPSYWSLNVNGMLAQRCSTSGVSYDNTNSMGVIGLGFANNSSNNYANNQPLFSLFMEKDGRSGELLFFSNLTKATTNVPIASLSSDNNWHITTLTNIVFTGINPQTVNVSAYEMVFDLNSDAIGLPNGIYSQIIQAIQQAGPNITCNETDIYLPTCNYTGDIDDLPVLQIYSANSSFPIYPEIYVANALQYNGQINGQINLNFKAISSSLDGPNYVSSSFEDYIIMDVNVLTYFYVVFSGDVSQSTGTISVYIANHQSEAVFGPGSPVLYIILGTVIILLLGGAAYWFFVRREKQVYAEDAREIASGSRSLLDDGLHSQL